MFCMLLDDLTMALRLDSRLAFLLPAFCQVHVLVVAVGILVVSASDCQLEAVLQFFGYLLYLSVSKAVVFVAHGMRSSQECPKVYKRFGKLT